MTTPPDFWLDAHLDLAYMALERSPEDPTLENEADGSRFAITRPALARGRVRLCFATIFTAPGEEAHEPWGYRDHEDRDGAHRAGMRQLEIYEDWEARGLIRIARTREDLRLTETGDGPPSVVILMECADPIRTPEEAAQWLLELPWSSGGALLSTLIGSSLLRCFLGHSFRKLLYFLFVAGPAVYDLRSRADFYAVTGAPQRLPQRWLNFGNEVVDRPSHVGKRIFHSQRPRILQDHLF